MLAAFRLLALSGCQPAPTVTAPVSAQPTDVGSAADRAVVDPGLRGYLEASGRHVTIERVLDGDTIAVNPGDAPAHDHAPERHVATPGTPDCGADDAWHALQGILPVGAEVIVNGLEGEPATDRYDRTLANVDARHVSLWLVEQGWAVTFENYPTAETDDARTLQAAAEQAGRGMWATCTSSEWPDDPRRDDGMLSIVGRLRDDAAVVGRGRCLPRPPRRAGCAGGAHSAARATTAPAESVVNGLDAAARYDPRPRCRAHRLPATSPTPTGMRRPSWWLIHPPTGRQIDHFRCRTRIPATGARGRGRAT